MDDPRSNNRIYAYMIYAVSIGVLALSLLSYNLLGIIVVATLAFLSVAYMNSGHIINSVAMKRLRVIEICGGYHVSGSTHSAIKRNGSMYNSVSVAVLKPNSKIEGQSRIFEELLDKIKIPFEFSISVRKLDRKKVIESLETRRRMKELELSRSDGPDYKSASMIKRQIRAIENEISIISEGNEPIEALVKLKSFASGETEAEAARMSFRQLEQIANLVASSFKLDYVIATGEDILDLL